jgi:hypothetical protein
MLFFSANGLMLFPAELVLAGYWVRRLAFCPTSLDFIRSTNTEL